jgi:hypothetical protein
LVEPFSKGGAVALGIFGVECLHGFQKFARGGMTIVCHCCVHIPFDAPDYLQSLEDIVVSLLYQ